MCILNFLAVLFCAKMSFQAQTQFKCGYCGYLINSQCENYLEHECFSTYMNENPGIGVDLCVDANNILTLALKNGERDNYAHSEASQIKPAHQKIDDELLISLVYARKPLWDFRLPLQQRQNNKITSLWEEIARQLGGNFEIDHIKKRWRQLRDDFKRAKNKATMYIPSGSGACELPAKPSFKYYDLMKFIDQVYENVTTVSNVPSTSSAVSTPGDTPPASSGESNCQSTFASPSPSMRNKRKRTVSTEPDKEIQKAILKSLEDTPNNKPDGVDGFLILMGEGLRRLPLRKRNRLQIKFLQILEDEESNLDSTN